MATFQLLSGRHCYGSQKNANRVVVKPGEFFTTDNEKEIERCRKEKERYLEARTGNYPAPMSSPPEMRVKKALPPGTDPDSHTDKDPSSTGVKSSRSVKDLTPKDIKDIDAHKASDKEHRKIDAEGETVEVDFEKLKSMNLRDLLMFCRKAEINLTGPMTRESILEQIDKATKAE